MLKDVPGRLRECMEGPGICGNMVGLFWSSMKVAGVLEYANMSTYSVDSFRGGVYCVYGVWSVSGCICMLCTVYGCGGSIYKCFVIV